MSLEVPEEAIAAAANALAVRLTGISFEVGEGKVFTELNAWEDAKEAVRAAAPLIVARELERLADSLPGDLGVRAVGDDLTDAESMPTYDEGVDDMQAALRGRASVLRGEVAEDVR